MKLETSFCKAFTCHWYIDWCGEVRLQQPRWGQHQFEFYWEFVLSYIVSNDLYCWNNDKMKGSTSQVNHKVSLMWTTPQEASLQGSGANNSFQ